MDPHYSGHPSDQPYIEAVIEKWPSYRDENAVWKTKGLHSVTGIMYRWPPNRGDR